MSARDDIATLLLDEANPAIVRMARALGRLRSTISVMNICAHPGDECSGFLAWLRHGMGMRVAIACATRGEGGQNLLGPERGDALGLLRTAEMQDAAKVLDAHLFWLGFGMSDPVHDFGFSKDGDDTLRRWKGDLVIRRLAGAYRIQRPDIVVPSFLDVPGQHGHHRAMTIATREAISLAADPGADLGEVPGWDRPAWQVAKLYLPAWEAAGDQQSDGASVPEATVVARADALDPISGAPYDRIGEWSRRRHATQGLGTWPDPPRREWPLHLPGGGPEEAITDGLPHDLRSLAADCVDLPGLTRVADQLDLAIAAFPDSKAVVPPLIRAYESLHEAEQQMTASCAALHAHRIARKKHEVALAVSVALVLRPRLHIRPRFVPAGGSAEIELASEPVEGVRFAGVEYHIPQGCSLNGSSLTVAKSAKPTQSLAVPWSPLGDQAVLRADVSFDMFGQRLTVPVVPKYDLRIMPPETVEALPRRIVLTPDHREAWVRLSRQTARMSRASGLEIAQHGEHVSLSWPATAPPGKQALRLRIADGKPAFSAVPTALPDRGEERLVTPALITVLSVDTAPISGRIGLISGSDHSGKWLDRLGADMTLLRGPDAASLARFDTVVIGSMALADEKIDRDAMQHFVERGGNLLCFSQRADLGWDEGRSAPLSIRLAMTPIRFRATDPSAEVEVLATDHPLLCGPNRVGPEDWQGWVQHRSLGFAVAWDDAFRPLIALSEDNGRQHRGALLSAQIGAGRFTYCALSLPEQMDALVSGAFRLFVNLVAPVAAGRGG
ncbi:PIG-L family deacetylase [Paracoccus sediminicola]|uniref:PIG-L family deacetylase n=1 Tax=Paracoccus sediminicola TaxID=3017783 RepID=UPI0022F0B7E1|nr:PIG-L family deacetylase [Paracoccus sediminicola]WBU56087.1 PIG-L family deacetylase [Paracoccus sediminicola]